MKNQEEIKKLKKNLRKIKNIWTFEEYTINNVVYEVKRYNNYIQFWRKKGDNKKMSFPYCETQKELIQKFKEVFIIEK